MDYGVCVIKTKNQALTLRLPQKDCHQVTRVSLNKEIIYCIREANSHTSTGKYNYW